MNQLEEITELENAIVEAETYAEECRIVYKEAKDKVAGAVNDLRSYIRDLKVGQERLFPVNDTSEKAK